MFASRHIDNALIIIAECIVLRDSMLVTKNYGFLNLEIEGYSKIVIDCYNKKNNIPNFIMLLMKNILKLSQNLNIYHYRETNRKIYCLVKKDICNIKLFIWWLNFLKDVTKFGFEDYCGSSFNQICRYSTS